MTKQKGASAPFILCVLLATIELPGRLFHRFHAEPHAALLVRLQHLDLHMLAFLEVIGHIVDALVGDLRNVQEPVLPR